MSGGKTLSIPSFKSGERIRFSGLYQVFHDAHHLPSQVALVKGHTFPPCAECAVPVVFRRVRFMSHLDKPQGNIVLNVLPVLGKKAA